MSETFAIIRPFFCSLSFFFHDQVYGTRAARTSVYLYQNVNKASNSWIVALLWDFLLSLFFYTAKYKVREQQ